MRASRRDGLLALVALCALVATGCLWGPDPDPVTIEHRIPHASLFLLEADIGMSAGDLAISGSSPDLMTGSFTFTKEAWEPEITYHYEEGHATLSVRTTSSVSIRSSHRNEWDIALTSGEPLALSADLGAGDLTIDARHLDLVSLSARVGAGDLVLDLSGTYTASFEATAQMGAGSIRILLPRDVGALVIVEGRTKVTASSLFVDGSTYTNRAYGTSPVTVRVTVTSSVGDVELVG